MSLDFNESELTTIQNNLNNRWRKEAVEVQLADIEMSKEGEREAKFYPAAVWEASNSTFIVLKIAEFSYKSFFYYLKDKRFDTGVDEYNDLHECVDKLLKAQADFVLSKNTKGLNVEINK
ncbi:hypothetical protein SPONN_2149 [uncultured Candidatus Thioglobus sp.]|nr:hypothetical protein SPONN_2149 [uncultured Candidatus Thioglobus sp.]